MKVKQPKIQATNTKNRLRFLPVGLFFIFILWVIINADLGTENPFVNFAHSLPFGDKLGHVFIFAGLTFLLNYALSYRFFLFRNIPIGVGTASVFLFALIEECSQLAFATRTFDLGDLLADFLGIFIASWVGYKYRKTK